MIEETKRICKAWPYDDLHRLTNASTTAASSTPYIHGFTYSIIGNITTASSTGSYTYAGTNYANPHAVTSINGVALTYDNNGNLTNYGNAGYSWDYRNQMTLAGTGRATSTYGYDYTGQRVSMRVGSTASTTYANRFFSTNNASTTKHIYAGDTLIATVEKVSSATTTHIIHPDHLGGTNAVTDQDGTVVQTIDYYPFGAQRVDTTGSAFDEGKEFIGEYRDETVGLSYLNARYYDPARGQFLRQDPVFWELEDFKLLEDPQQLNSYSYARNNPITSKDPNGEQSIASIANQLRAIIASLQQLVSGLQKSPAVTGSVSSLPMPSNSQAIGTGVGTASINIPHVIGTVVVIGAALAPIHTADDADYLPKEKDTSKPDEKPKDWRYMPDKPWESPGPDWEPKQGSIKNPNQRPYKDWHNPKTGETAHPDFDHPAPIGPHWDIKGPNGSYRIPPGGGVPIPK